MIITLIILSLIGAVIYAVVGTLWYSNATPMGKIHMQYLGFDKLSKAEQKKKMEEGKSMMPQMYAAQIGLSLLTSFAVVFIVTLSIQNRVPAGMAIGFIAFNWLAFMVPIIGQGILWSNCDRKLAWKKFFSDSLSNLVSVLIIALLASFFA
ncbi:MAG TPA: DUF1761 domain-containing protein [Candidatus Andersenbacteria bacterium]|nr:DUF1761 domain-containing protein [Candidatus Andersenbacteria bacterium]